jgi:hypothetical protein
MAHNPSGSDVIVSRDGIVVSTCHAVGTPPQSRGALHDRREFPPCVLSGDAQYDPAIPKIDAPDALLLPDLRENIRIIGSERALAVGNPFGAEQTLRSGSCFAVPADLAVVFMARADGVFQTRSGDRCVNSAPTDTVVFYGLSPLRITPAVLSKLALPVEPAGVAVAQAGRALKAGLTAGTLTRQSDDMPVTRPAQAAPVLSGSGRRGAMVVGRGIRLVSLQVGR